MFTSSDKLKVANTWLDLGAELLPILPGSKHILSGWGSHQRRIQTKQEAHYFFRRSNFNMGLALVGGWVCADFDELPAYQAWAAGAGANEQTYIELTGRGVHAAWKSAGDIPAGHWPQEKSPPDVAVMTSGYVVLSPSLHPSGKLYRVLVDLPPAQLTLDHALELFPFLKRPAPHAQVFRPLGAGGGHSKIEIIKDRFSIFEELEAAGAKGWRPAGGAVVACCPWHPDKNPSLWVLPHVRIWGCNQPACPAFGKHDVINIRMLRHGLTVGEAVNEMWQELQP
jgi:hypothetical protein